MTNRTPDLSRQTSGDISLYGTRCSWFTYSHGRGTRVSVASSPRDTSPSARTLTEGHSEHAPGRVRGWGSAGTSAGRGVAPGRACGPVPSCPHSASARRGREQLTLHPQSSARPHRQHLARQLPRQSRTRRQEGSWLAPVTGFWELGIKGPGGFYSISVRLQGPIPPHAGGKGLGLFSGSRED